MRTLEQEMAVYAAYHRDPRNKATHFVGVPLIVLAILIPLSWPGIEVAGFKLTVGVLLTAAVLAYYFILDVPLALAMLVVFAVLIWAAELLAAGSPARGWTWSGILFVGGWILQLVGHVFEGRRPALVDNVLQIFVAPIFLMAEVFFALGYKPELRKRLSSSARKASAAPSS